MRTLFVPNVDGRVDYPNTVHFSNVPAIIRVRYSENYDSASDVVTVTAAFGDSKVYTEDRVVHELSATFDIRRFLQSVFDGINIDTVDYNAGMWIDNPNFQKVNVVVSSKRASDEIHILHTFSTDAIFGNIERGESTGGNIRRRWFVNYPFTLDFFAKEGEMLSVVVDGVDRPGVSFPNHTSSNDVDFSSGFSRVLLNVSKLVDPLTIDKRIRIVQPFGYVTKNDEESIGLVAYDLDVDRSPADCEKGVYLRWIDNQGRFCYWLFKDLGTSDAVTGTSWNAAEIRNPLLYDGAINIGTDIRQSFSRTKTRNLGAKSVDREIFDFLLTLVSSPFVDVFDGYDADNIPQWHRVNVSPGTVAKSTKSRQDFTVAIVEPTQLTQSL